MGLSMQITWLPRRDRTFPDKTAASSRLTPIVRSSLKFFNVGTMLKQSGMAVFMLCLLFSLFSCVYSCSLITFPVTITEPDCQSTTTRLGGCFGHCSSSSVVSEDGHTKPQNLHMSCCAVIQDDDINVYLPCSGGDKFKTVKSATKCGCKGCHVS
jgi:hypothetical protein